MKIREVLNQSLLAFEAAGVFFTPLARRKLGECWSEYHTDALTRRGEAMSLLQAALTAFPEEQPCCGSVQAQPSKRQVVAQKKSSLPSEYPYRDVYTDEQWQRFTVQKRGAITRGFRRRLGLCNVCVKNPEIRRRAELDYENGWRPQAIQPPALIFRCGCGEIFGLDDQDAREKTNAPFQGSRF